MNKGLLIRIGLLVFALAAIIAMAAGVRLLTSSDIDGQTANKTFFEQFIISGGPIVWFVLLPMSLVAVFLLVEYNFTIRRSKLIDPDLTEKLSDIIEADNAESIVLKLTDRQDFVSIAVTRALSQPRADWFRIKNAVTESLQDQALELFRKIEWINLIGNVSPMVGLFGTVFGMIKLFNAIVTAGGQPQPVQLAEGISVALVTTFWGLFIAIPAVAIHGIFRNRIETLAGEAVVEAESVMILIRHCLCSPTLNRKSRQKASEQLVVQDTEK